MEINTTNVFLNNYTTDKKININRGGTRSGKTYNLLQLFLLWLLIGRITDKQTISEGVCSIVRKHKTTLKTSVMRDFEEVMDLWGVRELININLTDRTYKYGNRVIEFIGADDQQKLRGAKRNILYCNEANELEYKKEFFQLLVRTKDIVFIDFNPDDIDVWINTELEIKRQREKGDVAVYISTYKDNPYLTEAEIQEIEYLQYTDPMYWQIYGLGEYGKVQGTVFNNWETINTIPITAKLLGYGLDFGYTNDPTALVGLYMQDNEIYVKQFIYNTGLTNQDIIDVMKRVDIQNNIDIVADSAEPKSIEEIKRGGYYIYPVEKGADSINYGIDLLKKYKIYVEDTSYDIIKELKKYKRQEDKAGNSVNKPIDMFNHSIDALRYVAMMKLGRSKQVFGFI